MQNVPIGVFAEAAAASALLPTSEGTSVNLPLADGDWTGGTVALVVHGLATGALELTPEPPTPDAPYVGGGGTGEF